MLLISLRWAFIGLVFLLLLPKGTVDLAPVAAFTAILAALAAIAVLTVGEPYKTRVLFRLALGLGILLAAWIGAQAITLSEHPFAHPIWSIVSGSLDVDGGAISIRPADTVFAALYLALPFLVFLVALILFPDDEAAMRLLRALAVGGGIVAVLAIVQFEFLPGTLVFEPKRFYRDSLTAAFVNRNTAATFLGVAAVALFSVLIIEAQKSPIRAYAGWLVSSDHRRRPPIGWRLPAVALLLAAVFAALFLTKSRGGIGATLAAFMVVAPVAAATMRSEKTGRNFASRQSRFVTIAKAVAGFLAVLVLALAFAGRAAFRAEIQGAEDGRFCVMPGIWQAIRANWPFGTGFGTFREAFPAYRDPSCGLYGIWDRAHSVYLEAMLGLGLPALPAFALGIGTLIVVFAMGIRARRSLRAVPLAGLGVTIILVLHSAVDFSVQIPAMAAYAAAVLAAACTISLGRPARSPRKRTTAQI